MERFLQRYQSEIVGVLSGADRVLLRGVLRSVSYVQGLEIFLSSIGVLHRDFVAYAQKISQALIQHGQGVAEKACRPYLYLASARKSKEEIVRQMIARDQVSEGLVCVLGCVEPCRSVGVHRNRRRKRLDLVMQERRCLHLYFYYLDREFGLMHVRLQTWFPFSIQICVNGREWLGRKMSRAGMGYRQVDNCFTFIENPRQAQRWMDQFTQLRWVRWAERWVERTMPWMSSPDGRRLRGYYWTVRQAEFATDVMFRDAQSLARIYAPLMRHAIEHFRSEHVLRFLGRRCVVTGESTARMDKRREGVCVKHYVQENWIKMYDKQGSVLRIETTINNASRFKVWRQVRRAGKRVRIWTALRKGVVDLRRRGEICLAANRRYLDALSFAEQPEPACKTLDPVSKPCVREGRRYRPLRPISPEDGRKLALLRDGRFAIEGIRNRDLQELWPERVAEDADGKRTAGRITRWLRLLVAHRLLSRVPHTHCYRLTVKGNAVLACALQLRNADMQKLAA